MNGVEMAWVKAVCWGRMCWMEKGITGYEKAEGSALGMLIEVKAQQWMVLGKIYAPQVPWEERRDQSCMLQEERARGEGCVEEGEWFGRETVRFVEELAQERSSR